MNQELVDLLFVCSMNKANCIPTHFVTTYVMIISDIKRHSRRVLPYSRVSMASNIWTYICNLTYLGPDFHLWSIYFFDIRNGFLLRLHNIYCQSCIKRSPLGQRKRGLIRQVTSIKSFNSCKISYERTRKCNH